MFVGDGDGGRRAGSFPSKTLGLIDYQTGRDRCDGVHIVREFWAVKHDRFDRSLSLSSSVWG